MEVRALCIRLLIRVLVLLLPAQVQHSYSHKADAAFVHIVPSRLQFFEHEFVFINCDGFFNDLTKWRVMKKIKETTTTCKSKLEAPGPCNITTAFKFDSGEYWCEAEGKKSNIVEITVTDGSVILESPALPVTEGDNVILRCRNKTTSNLKADFYKDGLLIKNTTTGEMIIHSISKSDEGLYKCNIFEAGKSAESWLAVRADQEGSSVWIVVPILLVTVLLLLVMGRYYMKRKATNVAEPQENKHAAVTEPRGQKGLRCSYGTTPVPSARTDYCSLSPQEDAVYYTID